MNHGSLGGSCTAQETQYGFLVRSLAAGDGGLTQERRDKAILADRHGPRDRTQVTCDQREVNRAWSIAIAAAIIILRVVLVFRYRFDSDESQHLHVAWGWMNGLVQYRDVFDNHMPLFHLAMSPLFLAFGDHARILFIARLMMFPFYGATIWLTYLLARRIYGASIARIAALLTAVCPPFFLGTLEVRTDDAWVVFWLWTLLVLTDRRSRIRRCAYGGVLLGLAFGVSMKSILFLLAIAAAAVLTLWLTRRRTPAIPAAEAWRCAAVFLGTTAIVPAVIAAAYAMSGLWKSFVYGVVLHNRIPFAQAWRVVWCIPLYAIIRTVAPRMAAATGDVGVVRRRLFVFLCATLFVGILSAIWPMLSLESYLPFYPFAAVFAAVALQDGARHQRSRVRRLAAAAVAGGAFLCTVIVARPWVDETRSETSLIQQVLALTSAEDYVMDARGETLFRKRPYYLALEGVTNRRFRLGWVHDDIAAALVRTRTMVVATMQLPPHAKRFVQRSYLEWGDLRVAGVRLRPTCETFDGARVVEVPISGSYALFDEHGLTDAFSDGDPIARGIVLGRGRHVISRFSRCAEKPFLIWAGVLRGSPQLTLPTETAALRTLRLHGR